MNREMIRIGDTEIPLVEYQGLRVVTFKMIDEVHKRPSGTAGKRFSENKARFCKGKHYFEVSKSEIRTWPNGLSGKRKEDGNTGSYDRIPSRQYLITERGYLLLVKSFTDDLAWEVQERLIEGYFRVENIINTHTPRTTGEHLLASAQLILSLESAHAENTRRIEDIEHQLKDHHQMNLSADAMALCAAAFSRMVLSVCTGAIRPGMQFEPETSPVAKFVEERCRISSHIHTACMELYHAYIQWSGNGSYAVLGRTFFYREILRFHGVFRKKVNMPNGTRQWVFTGIGVKDSEQVTSPPKGETLQ